MLLLEDNCSFTFADELRSKGASSTLPECSIVLFTLSGLCDRIAAPSGARDRSRGNPNKGFKSWRRFSVNHAKFSARHAVDVVKQLRHVLVVSSVVRPSSTANSFRHTSLSFVMCLIAALDKPSPIFLTFTVTPWLLAPFREIYVELPGFILLTATMNFGRHALPSLLGL